MDWRVISEVLVGVNIELSFLVEKRSVDDVLRLIV